MKVTKIFQMCGIVTLTVLMMGCAGGSSALVQEKDAELERLRTELDQLEKRLETEKKVSKELSSKQGELKETLKLEQQKKQNYLNEIERLKASEKNQFVIGNRIVLTNAVVFKGGSAELSARGQQYMAEVLESLRKYPDREILIEGHCDNVPIASGYRWKYASNWELSAARALNVLHYFEKNSKLDPELLGAVAYGENRPIASNDTAEGRAQNRRVEIVVGIAVK
jgi:chemotaxis protein MotB